MTDDISNRDKDLRVSGHISIPAAELEFRASRSGGPGGQHVNTSSTKIEVRWSVTGTNVLSEDEKERVRARLGDRVDTSGTIRVVSSESRSQARNREIASARLADLIRKALAVPRKRKPTRRPRGANEDRLREKKRRSEQKRRRSDAAQD
jgi:ribosome-associated protein